MCGLIGMFGNLFLPDKYVLKQGLIGSSFRGPHSTGIGYSTKEGNQGLYKKAMNAQYYLDHGGVDVTDPDKPVKWSVDDWINSWFHTATAVMGHNRWATLGDVNDSNAHPFHHGNILLAHNGGIRDHHKLTKDFFQVDSEAVAKRFSEVGAVDTLKEIDGDFTFTWHDKGDNTFNMIRNAGRPLWIAEHQYRAAWYYASEPEMLEWILSRNKIAYKRLIEAPVGLQYIWHPDRPNVLETVKRELYRGRFPAVQTWGGHQGYRPNWAAQDDDRGPYNSGGRRPIGPTQVQESRKEIGKETQETAAVLGADAAIDELQKRREDRIGQEFLARANGQLKLLTHASSQFLSPHTRVGKTWNLERGKAWLETLGLIGLDGNVVDTRYTGYFDTWENYGNTSSTRAITADSIKKQRGRVFGSFDSNTEVDCTLRQDNLDLLEYSDGKGGFAAAYYSFQIDCCRYNEHENEYVLFVKDLREINWEDDKECELGGIPKPHPIIEINLSDIGDEDYEDGTDLVDDPEFLGHNGRILTRAEWEQKTKYGCGSCNCSLDEEDTIHWFDSDSPLCGVCMDEKFGVTHTMSLQDMGREALRMLH